MSVKACHEELWRGSLAVEQAKDRTRNITQKGPDPCLEGHDVAYLTVIPGEGPDILNKMKSTKSVVSSETDLIPNEGDCAVSVELTILPVYVIGRIEDHLVDS
jgi:hypothetical protein